MVIFKFFFIYKICYYKFYYITVFYQLIINHYYNIFSVTIESIGAMEPSEIFLEALTIISKKVTNALESALNQSEI